MKLKVTSADARTIQTDKGITFGADKHPQMFKTVNGFRAPNHKKGDEISHLLKFSSGAGEGNRTPLFSLGS